MKTILALIDFSDVTSKILEHAQALSKAFGSEVILMHVVPPEPLVVDFAAPAVPPELFLNRQKELIEMRDTLVAQGVPAMAQVFGGQLEQTLLEQIKQIKPDLILAGSHGHGALYNLVVGSVTAGIINHAGLPVLVVPSVPVRISHLERVEARKARKSKYDTLIGVRSGAPAFP